MNQLRKIITWLGLSNKSFCFVFNHLNKFVYRYAFVIKYIKKEDLYLINDYGNDYGNEKLYITRKSRIRLYKYGVDNRLKFLISQYLLDDFHFNEGDIVIDIGANIGEFSYYLAKKYKAKVISIEPEEKEFNCLKLNCKESNIELINKALWSEETEMTFYQKNDTGDSSLFKTSDYKGTKKIKTATLSTIIHNSLEENEKIKLLKLEAEGAEPEILMGAIDILNRIEYIVADVGPERGLKSENTLIEVLNILQNNGFEAIRFGDERGILLFKKKK